MADSLSCMWWMKLFSWDGWHEAVYVMRPWYMLYTLNISPLHSYVECNPSPSVAIRWSTIENSSPCMAWLHISKLEYDRLMIWLLKHLCGCSPHAQVALKTMAYPEQLMYSGNVMEDGKKLSDYDINKPMGVYDYIWINSAENQAMFAKDLQFHKGDLKTKYHYLREKFQGSCWSFWRFEQREHEQSVAQDAIGISIDVSRDQCAQFATANEIWYFCSNLCEHSSP